MSLLENFDEMLKIDSQPIVDKGDTRDERILNFNKSVDENNANRTTGFVYSSDFERKRKGGSPPLASLRSLSLSQLEVGKTHRGCVVYCRIATRVLQLSSAMVLVEDKNSIVDLAVYGQFDVRQLKEGRTIAITEPFYKIRNDGTEGIRVDDPTDIVFDPRGSVEDRLAELVLDDSDKGIDKLYSQLVDEGFKIKKKRIRALKKMFVERSSSSNSANIIDNQQDRMEESNSSPFPDAKNSRKACPKKTSILSQRKPEFHRIVRNPVALKFKEDGNKHLLSKDYSKAEGLYTEALKNKDNAEGDDSIDEIHLWQLYSNRCAARIHMGKLQEALQDSLEANKCAPEHEVKPILRCSEALVALGLRDEASKLLKDAANKFSDNKKVFEKKEEKTVRPSKVIRVGKLCQITSISAAIFAAPHGAEIIVEPGLYRENLYINKPLTIRCKENKHCSAITSLDDCDTNSHWAEVQGIDGHSILVNNTETGPVHLIGLKISCEGPIQDSFHSIYTFSGTLVVDNCICVSSSGPVLVATGQRSHVITRSCVFHKGKQGGVLAVDYARLTMHQVYCCHNAAVGLELRWSIRETKILPLL
jgi:tetratricopeptide (TPR) repeat protein